MRAVVLFDIDGTLIRRAGPQHRLALIDAIRDVTGFGTTFDGIDTSGRLDRDLIRIMLAKADAQAEVAERSMPAIVRLAQRFYCARTVDLRRRVCPGVRVAYIDYSWPIFPWALLPGTFRQLAGGKWKPAV